MHLNRECIWTPASAGVTDEGTTSSLIKSEQLRSPMPELGTSFAMSYLRCDQGLYILGTPSEQRLRREASYVGAVARRPGLLGSGAVEEGDQLLRGYTPVPKFDPTRF